jgi:hypothetical protein
MIDLSSPLDITNWKDKGLDLKLRIDKEVKSIAKSKILVDLPSKLQMTQDQFDDLNRLNHLPTMYHTEDRMYVTKYNVMEVRVDNRTKLTFQEAHSLDDKAFDEWEKSVEGEDG